MINKYTKFNKMYDEEKIKTIIKATDGNPLLFIQYMNYQKIKESFIMNYGL
ncbi:hypothetical protein PL321_10140 [Caloramator sp. mosi_1]|uniref:hypothetical protein n=1 Tax=Caloramator sp. mosi_1 TaxID=3023090 RepID=UPI002360B898|nr:hypothetical protein [Caloramator sp. mosi_1]WDC83179.1 hypothetical protein PL321_10140 [Caloramator sp. mosi_1]